MTSFLFVMNHMLRKQLEVMLLTLVLTITLPNFCRIVDITSHGVIFLI